MAAVKELIRAEEDGSISFGDYELAAKSKRQEEYQGDIYKVKTFREITKLERNTPQRVRMYLWLEGQDADCRSDSTSVKASAIVVKLELAGATG